MAKTIKKFIDITPHRSILSKISQTGYSVQEALSELIDNAIDARLSSSKLLVNVSIAKGKIIVEDNGSGMNEEEVSNSIRLGFSGKKKKLGEFGLGLKTSTSFLGEAFELKTSSIKSDREYILKYDEKEWLEKGDWFNYPLLIKEKENRDLHGTRIAISKLKFKFSEKELDDIFREFGLRFGPFISNGELELFFNGKACHSFDPEIISRRTRVNFSEEKIKARGWWAYKLSGLNKSYFGFNTFRRGRLVTTYDKMGLNPNQDIKQIIGEIEIDGIPITHDKKDWLRTSDEYRLLERKMREYFKQYEKKPKKLLSGYAVSGGKIAGRARIVNMFVSGDMEKEMSRIKSGDIIVTAMTRPHFLLGIRRSKGIITDMGGTLCHAAIAAREFNIPSVVGTQTATSILRNGQKIILDGDTGTIYEDC